MDIEINTFDGIKLKTANTYVEEDINLSVSDKAFEEILYDGEVENGTLGENKLASYVNKTITEVTEQDLQGATAIRDGFFSEYKELKKVIIPNTVTSIGQRAFYNCSNLMEVKIPGSVTSIGMNLFYGCSNLESAIVIPNGVTSIPVSTFQGCKKIPSIYIPNGVTAFSNYAFYNCSSLTSVTIPNSVTSLGSDVFASCTSLKEVIFEENSKLTSIGRLMFSSCSALTSITIPNTVTSIALGAFNYCTVLTNLTIPSNVTSIESSALKIGSTENKATIIFEGTTPPTIQSDTFNKSNLEKIIVSKGYGEVYKTATNWSNFADYIEEATE